MKRQLLIAFLACSAAAASAQTVYRCGNAYSEQACDNPTMVLYGVHAPTAAQVAAARSETEREMKAADAMEKARLKEEAKPVAVYIPQEKAEKIAEHKPEVFTARVPGAKHKKAKKKTV